MIKITHKYTSVIVTTIMLAVFFFPSVATARKTVRIGVLAYRGAEETVSRWQPTARYLAGEIPQYSFVILPFDLVAIQKAVALQEVDFVITNPGNYVELESHYGATRIATLTTVYKGRSLNLFGAVIFTKANRSDIIGLRDLRGKTFLAVEEEAFGGWLLARREFNDNDMDPFRDLAGIEYTKLPQDLVVYGIRDGKADAGTVRTGLLEDMAAEGKINLADFRILNPRRQEGFPQLLSTRLYPEWAFAKAKNTSEKFAAEVAVALLKMPPDSAAAMAANIEGWTVPLDYQPVHDLMKELRIGPYKDYGKVTAGMFVSQYRYWIVALFVLTAGVAVLIFGYNKRLRRAREELEDRVSERTAELERSNINLKASEVYNRALFESSVIGMALCRMDGALVDVNQAYAGIIGRTVEETLKLTYWDITPEKYAAQEQAQLESIEKTGSYGPYEKEYIHKDGRPVPVRLQGRIIEQRGEKFIWSSVEDITERKRAEETLRRNEAVLRLFVEYSPAAIAMFDLDMKYIAASRRYLADYELGDQDLAVRHHYEVFPEMPERWKKIHKRCLAGAIERCDEDPFLRADGTLNWVKWEIRPWYESADKIGGIIIFSEVITEYKKAQEELRTTNEELLAINRIITTTATATAAGVREILEKVLDEVLHITGLEGGTICMVTPEETLHLAAHRETSEATIQDLTANEIKIGDCLCGECARDHKPLILRDREAVLNYSTREAQRGEDIRFHAAFPLIAGETCLGVLCVFTRTDRKPPERSLKLLETVTAQIAMALENARLYEETLRDAAILENRVKERTAELESKIAEIERMNRLFVGRELRMKELKEKIRELESVIRQ